MDNFLNMPIPQEVGKYKRSKLDWLGINYRNTNDSGAMSFEKNISSDFAPFMSPCMSPKSVFKVTKPIGIWGFGDVLIVVYYKDNNIMVGRYRDGKLVNGVLKANASAIDAGIKRQVVQFNVYDTDLNAGMGAYVRKLLFYPDMMSMDFSVSSDFTLSSFSTADNVCPKLDFVVVHGSRVFGVANGRVYASAFNDYSKWDFDTADEYSPNNAWFSPAGSNTKAGGDFTGITSYGGSVIAFKRDFIHEVKSTKNPFRIIDVFNEGAIDNRSIADVDGSLFFVSSNGVKIYSGGNPRDIGYNLGIDNFEKAVAGADGRRYYLYTRDNDSNDRFFVYDSMIDVWSERYVQFPIVGFANTSEGMYSLLSNGDIMLLSSGDYEGIKWECVTDVMLDGSISIKHLRCVNLYADIAMGANVDVYAIFDDDEPLLVYASNGKVGKIPIRVMIRRGVHYGLKLRFAGTGLVKLMSLEFVVAEGGVLNV